MYVGSWLTNTNNIMIFTIVTCHQISLQHYIYLKYHTNIWHLEKLSGAQLCWIGHSTCSQVEGLLYLNDFNKHGLHY